MQDPLTVLSLADLRRRTSVKWRRFGAEVIPMWVAEMDVPLAEPVVEAVTRALATGDTGYPEGTGYAEALADFARERWGWAFAAEQAALVPDVMTGIADVLRIVTGPGDTVVINPPVYPPFFDAVRHGDRRLIEAPLGDEGRLDFDRLDRSFGEARSLGRGAAYLLCSPHNPTGAVHTRPELERVAELARRHEIRVIADEIHAPLVYSGSSFVAYLSVAGTGDAFAIHSASKAWHLAGLKAALAIAGEDAEPDLARLRRITHPASHVGVIAHTAALALSREWLDALLAGLQRNRDRLAALLAERLPAVRCREAQGTFLAWLDCRELTRMHDPAGIFLAEGGVALSPGPSFGTGGAGHARLNFACPPALLEEGVARMASAAAAPGRQAISP